MIKQQLRTGDVLDEVILDLYEEIPRSFFVPSEMRDFAYSDMQIPYAFGQKMMSPEQEGKLLQALNLKGYETVLEVGTGTGFFTALLSRLSKKVISIDFYKELIDAARPKLAHFKCDNVELITGDAFGGWVDQAPYDIVILNGGIEFITDLHRLQVLPGGKLTAIIGIEHAMKCVLFELDHQNHWTETPLFDTCLPPLINLSKVKEFVF